MLGRIRTAIQARPVVAFFALAYLWSWTYDALVFLTVGPSPGILVRGIVRTWGPLVAAVAVTWACRGDVRAFLGQVTTWRVTPYWYVLVLTVPLVLEGTAAYSAVHLLQGGAVEVLTAPWWRYALGFLVVLLLAGGLEEFGWRGFAQPRLQERYSALTAAVGIGLAWGCWHLPMFYLYDVPAYDPGSFWTTYLFSSVVTSIYYAWFYNGTGGALLFPMVAHALGNLPGIVTPRGEVTGVFQYTQEALAVLLVLALVARYGRTYLAATAPSPRVPGRRQ